VDYQTTHLQEQMHTNNKTLKALKLIKLYQDSETVVSYKKHPVEATNMPKSFKMTPTAQKVKVKCGAE
jgi:hypothetical protein